MSRRNTVFLWTGAGLMPLALGTEVPSFGTNINILNILGLLSVVVAVIRSQRGTDSLTMPFRWIAGLLFLAYIARLSEPWSSEIEPLAWLSYAETIVVPLGYFLFIRSGIAVAHSLRETSLKRSWQFCAWIGLPLILLANLLSFVSWVASGFIDGLHLESQNVFALIGFTLVLSLPAVLLLHAVPATQKVLREKSGERIRLPLRILAHPGAAVLTLLLFLTPAFLLVPHAIHYAVTPSFNEFLTANTSAFSFEPLPEIEMLGRHPGLVYSSPGWISIQDDLGGKRERLGSRFSVKLTRPDATLLNASTTLELRLEPTGFDEFNESRSASGLEVEDHRLHPPPNAFLSQADEAGKGSDSAAPTAEAFKELRLASEIETVDSRFHLTLTAFLHRSDETVESGDGAASGMEFVLQIALLAGPGDTTVETVLVRDLDSISLNQPEVGTAALSYIWQARGKFKLVPSCDENTSDLSKEERGNGQYDRKEGCLSPHVRYLSEQRFDISTEEYSYAMGAKLRVSSVTINHDKQYNTTTANSKLEDSIIKQSREISWNDVPW